MTTKKIEKLKITYKPEFQLKLHNSQNEGGYEGVFIALAEKINEIIERLEEV